MEMTQTELVREDNKNRMEIDGISHWNWEHSLKSGVKAAKV